jgi:hypothetical protein
MALRQAARQLLGNRASSVVTVTNSGALQARARARAPPDSGTRLREGCAHELAQLRPPR